MTKPKKQPRNSRRPWRHDEIARLDVLVSEGYDAPAIGRMLGRTAAGVCVAARRYLGGLQAHRSLSGAEVYTIRSAADLIGRSAKVIMRLVDRGVIESKRTEKRWFGAKGRERFITAEALITFLDNPRYWMLWNPETITDPDLRAYTEEQRKAAGGYWIRSTQAYKMLGYQITRGAQLCRRGYFETAVCEGVIWYIWSTEVEAHLKKRGNHG